MRGTKWVQGQHWGRDKGQDRVKTHTNTVGVGGDEDGKSGWMGFSGFLNVNVLAPSHCCIVALLSSSSLLRSENSKTARCENIQTVTLYLQVVILVLSPASR